MEREIAKLLAETAVNEDVNFGKQGICGRIVLLQQFLQREAGIAPDIKAACVNLPCQPYERRWLHKWLAAAECSAGQQRVGIYFCQDGLSGRFTAAAGCMGFGIMAAGAMMRAALRKDGQTHALAIDDGIIGNTGNSKFHGNAGRIFRALRLEYPARFTSFGGINRKKRCMQSDAEEQYHAAHGAHAHNAEFQHGARGQMGKLCSQIGADELPDQCLKENDQIQLAVQDIS